MVRALIIASALAVSSADRSYTDIICPFLSTLVNEKAIPVQDYYQKEELMAVVLNAGLSQKEANKHIHSQFRNIRSNRIDIFNMEGLPIEHYSSSGMNDCISDYTHYDQCPDGPSGSPTQGVRVCETTPCTVPVAPDSERAYLFWGHFDRDQKGYLTETSLRYGAKSWEAFSNDINEDPGVEGKIDDVYTYLMHTFGDGDHTHLTYTDFNRIVMQRRYPVHYTFGQGCNTTATQNPEEDFPIYSAYPFGIRDHYGRWLTLSGTVGIVMASDKTVWTADPMDEDDGYALRASGPTTYEAGQYLNIDGESLMGSTDKVTGWQAVQDKDMVLIKAVACEGSGSCTGFLSADTYGNVRVSQTASTNELFELVYCDSPLSDEPVEV